MSGILVHTPGLKSNFGSGVCAKRCENMLDYILGTQTSVNTNVFLYPESNISIHTHSAALFETWRSTTLWNQGSTPSGLLLTEIISQLNSRTILLYLRHPPPFPPNFNVGERRQGKVTNVISPEIISQVRNYNHQH